MSPPAGRRHFTLAGKVTAGFLVLLVLIAALAAAATYLPLDPWTLFLLILFVALPLGAWIIRRILRPLETVVQGLADGISSFRDRDFSTRLAWKRFASITATGIPRSCPQANYSLRPLATTISRLFCSIREMCLYPLSI